jgi:hypothetical protein
MNDLTRVLRDIHDRLDLPQPARSRVIIEIASDIQDLEEQLVGEGMALERCDLSDDAVAELARVHSPVYRRFLDRLSAQARTRWERSMLALACLVVVLTTGQAVVSVEVLRAGGVVAWLATAVAVAALLFAATRGYAAFVAQDHDPVRLRRGLVVLPAAVAYNLLLAAVGAWGGFFRVAWRFADNPADGLVLLTGWLRTSTAATIVCLLSAILVGMLWYVVESKVTRIEQAEAALLLQQ